MACLRLRPLVGRERGTRRRRAAETGGSWRPPGSARRNDSHVL